ncbi:MAG: NifU family protein [Rhodospirillales bacterium]|nr:NifU family protein [Rhodospirillales bacterium]
MFIQTEETPNPLTLKFLPGRPVMESGTANFPSVASAGRSPLALSLFDLEGVTGVYLGADFITVTKGGDRDWYTMKPSVLGVIMEHFTANKPVIVEGGDTAGGEAGAADGAGEDSELVIQIKELIDTRVRPAVAQDGGDIVFQSFEEGVVYLHMQGSCSGCPSSTATLKMGIENMLKHYIPEVVEVRAV